MKRTLAALLATLLLALAVAACGDEREPPPATPDASPAATATPTPVATATPAADGGATPAADGSATPAADGSASPTVESATPSPGRDEVPPLPDSIRTLLEEVAEVRGLEAPETMRALTVARANLYDTYLDLVTEEDRAELDEATEVYRLLGYLDDDEHLWDIQTSFLDLVLGFYSSDRKTLWVVTEEEGVGLEDLTRPQRSTLVHEILHALQDYHFDLGATFDDIRGNLDAELAFTAVVEGDAVVHTERHAVRYLSLPGARDVYFLASANQSADLPPAVLREIFFPYRTGASWAGFVLTDAGTEALNALLAEPPPATTLILHRELLGSGWEPEEVGESSLPAGEILDGLGPGWRVRRSGSLGEFHLINYLAGDAPYLPNWLFGPTSRAAVEAAKGWAGDRYSILEGGDERVLVARVRFVDEEEAAQFATTHRTAATRRAEVAEEDGVTLATRPDGKVVALIEPVGRDVIFAIGTSAEVARAALAPLVGG